MDGAFVGVDGNGAFEEDLFAARNVEPALAMIGAGLEGADRLPRRALRAGDDLGREIVDVVERGDEDAFVELMEAGRRYFESRA